MAKTMTNPINFKELKVYCRLCTRRGEDHRGDDSKCPGTGKFPAWPTRAANPDKAFDKAIEKYWAETDTYYKPRT